MSPSRSRVARWHAGSPCHPLASRARGGRCVYQCLIDSGLLLVNCTQRLNSMTIMIHQVGLPGSFARVSEIFALSVRYTCHSPPECDNCTGLNWCSDETWLQDYARRQAGNYRNESTSNKSQIAGC